MLLVSSYVNSFVNFDFAFLVSMLYSCRTVALYGPLVFFLADHRATDFTYIKISGIATRFKSHLSMGRLMIGCKCVLPCVVISFHI